MKITYLDINYLIVTLLFVFTSCNGQAQKDLSNENKNQQTHINSYQTKIVRAQGAKSGNLNCEFQDRDGNIWFSTDGEGVYRFDGKLFINFTTENGLCDNNANAIIQDKLGNILIGTNAGICKYDGEIFSKYFETDTLNNLRIIALLEDKDGNIWFSAMNKGIYKYDGTNLSNFLCNYKHRYFGDKQEKMISNILQDKMGNIWFSSFNRGGVWRFDGKILNHFLPSDDYYLLLEDEKSNDYSDSDTKYVPSPEYITDDMITSMTEDKNGNIWFATRRHGICIYDGKSFKTFKENEVFVKYSIISILEDKKGIFWLGTDEGGVFSYDGKTLKNYTTTDGLVNNAVRSILEDKNGNLWFGTRWFGLSSFDGKTFTTYSEYKVE